MQPISLNKDSVEPTSRSGSVIPPSLPDDHHSQPETDAKIERKVEEKGLSDKVPKPKSDAAARTWSWWRGSAMSREKTPSEIDQPKQEATITYKVAKQTVFEWMKEKVAVGAAPLVSMYANHYKSTIDKAKSIANAKQEMLNQLHDPLFVECYEMAKSVLRSAVSTQLKTLEGNNSVAAGYVLPNRALILDLLDMNLARGFVNLARQIPHDGKLPTLVRVLSLLCQKGGAHLDKEKLAHLEEKYRGVRANLRNQKQKLFAGINPGSEEAIQKYIQEYIKTTDKVRKEVIKKELFSSQDKEDLRGFFATLDSLHERSKEFNQLFRVTAEDMLVAFFPNKLADIEGPGALEYAFIRESIYDLLIDSLANFLQQSFESLEDDPVRNQAWENELQLRVGAPSLKPIIEAPASLLTAAVKNYIQADPQVMDLTAWMLGQVMSPEGIVEQVKGITPEQVKETMEYKGLLNQLSQQQLAQWIVASVQALFHTEDPHLEGLGRFVRQGLNHLALALMAQGVELVIPKSEHVESNAFLKEFTDRLVKQLSALQGEEVTSVESWKCFVKDLPLPFFVKDLFLSLIKEKGESLQTKLKAVSPEIQEIQKVYVEAEQKMLSYEGGAQLLAITEALSAQIIDSMLQENLVTTLGLGDTVEELYAQYLPGLVLGEELKTWFKENISLLAKEGGESPQSIVLMKKGIQALLCKAMVNTIEKNFKDNSKDYAAKLLRNFQEAFEKAFVDFNEAQRKEMDAALEIQAQIQEKQAEIKRLKKEIAKEPLLKLASQQSHLLAGEAEAKRRCIRALNYINRLTAKKETLALALAKYGWALEDLPTVSQALVLYKMRGASYATQKEDAEVLQREIEDLTDLKIPLTEDQEKKLINLRQILRIINTPIEGLKFLSEGVALDATLKQAKEELIHLEGDLQVKRETVDGLDEGEIGDFEEWEEAKRSLREAGEKRGTINALSEEIVLLKGDLDAHLGPFQVLSEELTGLLGLDEKVMLDLPSFLKERVSPLIQSAKKQDVARFLFAQLVPLIVSISDIEHNKHELTELCKEDALLGQLIQASCKEIISRVPEFIASYAPSIKHMLRVMGIDNPNQEEVNSMMEALHQTLVALGKTGTTASMLRPLVKGHIPKPQGTREAPVSKSAMKTFIQGKEGALSTALAQLIAQSGEEKIVEKDVLAVLAKEMPPNDKKEEKKLAKSAKSLTKSVNQFLFNRGKANLKPQNLVEAYEGQIAGKEEEIPPIDEQRKRLADVQSSGIVEEIKRVIISPEEVAEALNDAIPGATELHRLIAPQLEAVIAGDDPTFQQHRELLERFLEGTILRLSVKIAKANQAEGRDVLSVIAEKVNALAQQAPPVKGDTRTTEDIARQTIDQVLESVLDLSSKEDLDNIPLALQKEVFKKIKEQAYQQLTPLIVPIVERNQNQEKLRERSGSRFLGNLCKTLSKDVFALLPIGVNRHQAVKTEEEKNQILITPEEIIESAIPSWDPSLKKGLASQIQGLIHDNPSVYQPLSEFLAVYLEGMLLKLLMGVAEKNPKSQGKDTLIVLTERLLGVVATKYQEVKGGKNIEEAAKELNDTVIKDLLGMASADAFTGFPDPLKEKLYDGIKDQLKNLLLSMHQSLATLDGTSEQVKKAKDKAKEFGIAADATKSYVQILTEDLANMVMKAVPYTLTEIAGEKMKGVTLLSRSVERYLEELSRGGLACANVLLNYAQGAEFQQILGDRLTTLADQNQAVEDKQKVADAVSHLLIVPLTQVIEKAIHFEEKNKQEFNQRLMTHFLRVGARHLRHLNAAKALAAKEGRAEVLHQDVVKAAEGELHRAVPTTPVTYQVSMDAISQRLYGMLSPEQQKASGRVYPKLTQEQEIIWRQEQSRLGQWIAERVKQERLGVKNIALNDVIEKLNTVHETVTGKRLTEAEKRCLRRRDSERLTLIDLIQQEAETLNLQRKKEAYDPATQAIMNMLFPNGKNDLTFIPEKLRGGVWNALKRSLFPQVLPMMTEMILDPMNIKMMVLSSLETTKASLLREIVLKESEPADRPLDELDEVSGELILEVLKGTTLPDWMKKFVVDPSGEVNSVMKKTMGATLRQQFNDHFIKDKLQMALEQAVARNSKGEPLMKFDTRPSEVKKKKRIKKAEEVEQKLKKVSREVVDLSISYFIRSRWVSAQARFDALVEKTFGKVGSKVKGALDQVFGYIFFKIVGTLLSVLFSPLKHLVKEAIYKIISLDKNRDDLLAMMTKAPKDQPETSGHVVYNEDLIFKMGETLHKTVQEFLEEVPSPKEDLDKV